MKQRTRYVYDINETINKRIAHCNYRIHGSAVTIGNIAVALDIFEYLAAHREPAIVVFAQYGLN